MLQYLDGKYYIPYFTGKILKYFSINRFGLSFLLAPTPHLYEVISSNLAVCEYCYWLGLTYDRQTAKHSHINIDLLWTFLVILHGM